MLENYNNNDQQFNRHDFLIKFNLVIWLCIFLSFMCVKLKSLFDRDMKVYYFTQVLKKDTTLWLHYNAVLYNAVSSITRSTRYIPNVWKCQQTFAVYTMQAVKIILPVYFLATS